MGRVVFFSLESDLKIRRAVPEDAPGIVAVLAAVVDERVHSAIDRVWSVEQKRLTSNCFRRERSYMSPWMARIASLACRSSTAGRRCSTRRRMSARSRRS